MTPSFDPHLSHIIEELRARLASDTGSTMSEERAAAIATGGLPVYADLGGILAITPAGQVVSFDHDSGKVSRIDDDRWRTVAWASASRRFPALATLRPARPSAAGTCPSCNGTGVLLATATCGKCLGLGWIT
jgi:hypothetical protein